MASADAIKIEIETAVARGVAEECRSIALALAEKWEGEVRCNPHECQACTQLLEHAREIRQAFELPKNESGN